MPMFCPQCRNSFEERVECPTCGVKLFYQAARTSTSLPTSFAEEKWQQTPWGRIFAGLLLAQGLYHGLWHLFLAAQAALGEELSRQLSLHALLSQQILQLFSLIVGGTIAGASHRRGAAYGAVVGIWSGALFLLYLLVPQSHPGQEINVVLIYVLPILHTTFGALGGMIGSSLWNPPPDLIDLSMPSEAYTPTPKKRTFKGFDGPVRWTKVLMGVSIAVAGTLSATVILEVVKAFSVEPRAYEHEELMTWEIFALAMLAGSSLAGFGRLNGLKQGFWVGVCTGLILCAVQVLGVFESGRMPPQALIFKLMGWLQPFSGGIEILSFTLLCTLGMGLLGGWFGSKLLPPAQQMRRRLPKVPPRAASPF